METAKLLENILSLFGEQAVVVDAAGYIIASSPGWTESIMSNGGVEKGCGIGSNYLERSKDVYDLAFLLPKANAVVLGQALKRCFEYRKTEFPHSFTTVLKSMDTKALQRGWISATASIADKPKFQDNFETIAILINRMESSF